MHAIIHDEYGPPDGLALREIETPAPGDAQLLVRVVAAGLHRGDAFIMRGSPLPARFATGLLRPRYGVPGLDFAGIVEAVGTKVEGFAPGDEVFGECHGACAELAIADPGTITHKPESMSFEQAAALPTSALAALQGLRDAAKLEAGQTILINGAAGGVGHFAVQIAKALGAEVTGVCGPASADMVRSLGCNHVIDYTEEDFTKGQRRYDIILDNVENRPLAEVRGVLAHKGTLVLNSATHATGLAMFVRLIKPILLSPFVGQHLVRFFSSVNADDLAYLVDLFESERLRPVIEHTYPLARTPEAIAKLEQGHTHGKLVVSVGEAAA